MNCRDIVVFLIWAFVLLCEKRGQGVLGQQQTETYNRVLIAGRSSVAGRFDGQGTAATFNSPLGLIYNRFDNNFYISDWGNSMIRRMSPSGMVTTIAGHPNGTVGTSDGLGTIANFNRQQQLVINPRTGQVLIADTNNYSIRIMDLNGTVQTFMKNICYIRGITVDGYGNYLAACNSQILKISPDDMSWSVIAGSSSPGNQNGFGTEAMFNVLTGIAVNSQGIIFVGDYGNNRICRVTPEGNVTTFVGDTGVIGNKDGFGTDATFTFIRQIVVDRFDNLYIGSSNLRKVTPSGNVSTVDSSGGIAGVEVDPDGNIWYTTSSSVVRKLVVCYPGCSYNSTILACSCINCMAGSRYDAIAGSCSLCPEGQFKNSTGLSPCINCPIGTESSSSRQSCIACPLGKERTSLSQTKCDVCSTGKYRASLDWPTCRDCPVNSICYPTYYTCKPEFGFNSLTGTCHLCPFGTYQVGEGSNSTCIGCPIGTESSSDRKTCVQCSQGLFRPNLNSTVCIKCPTGAACNATSFQCLPGYHLNSIGDGCALCPSGFAKAEFGNAAICSQCPVGYESNSNRTSCSLCGAETFRPSLVYSDCINCPQGATCTPFERTCLAGYQPSLNFSDSCQICSGNTFKDKDDNSACIDCPEKSWSSDDFKTCLKCAAGEYQNTTGSCIPCGPGKQPNLNRTLCENCASGKYKPPMEYKLCIPCPNGADCDLVSFNCRAGFEINSAGNGCRACLNGKFKNTNGNTAKCESCPVGTQSNSGRTDCEPCQSGTYRSSPSFPVCIPCPFNYKSCNPDSFTCQDEYYLSEDKESCVSQPPQINIPVDASFQTTADSSTPSPPHKAENNQTNIFLNPLTYAFTLPILVFLLAIIVVAVIKWRNWKIWENARFGDTAKSKRNETNLTNISATTLRNHSDDLYLEYTQDVVQSSIPVSTTTTDRSSSLV